MNANLILNTKEYRDVQNRVSALSFTERYTIVQNFIDDAPNPAVLDRIAGIILRHRKVEQKLYADKQ